MKKHVAAVSCLLLVGGSLLVDAVQAQQNQSADEITSLLDSFIAEPVALNDEQQSLYFDDVFNYKEDSAVTEEVRKQWLQLLESQFGSAATAEEIEKTFGPDNLPQLVSQYFSDSGFQSNNYFDVMTIDLLISLIIAQDRIDEGTPTEGDIQIRDQFVADTTSEQILARRKIDSATRQKTQQLALLATLFKLELYVNAASTGEEGQAAELRRSAEARLMKTYGIDPRFQSVTNKGIDLTQNLFDVMAGKKTLQDAYPGLDLAKLSEPPSAPITGLIAELLTLFVSNSTTTNTNKEANPLGEKRAENPVNPLAVENAAAASTSVFTGNFKGDGLQLSLIVANTKATGLLVFNSEEYPVVGIATENTMSGTFNVGSGEFPFDASIEAKQLRFETGGKVYNLSGE